MKRLMFGDILKVGLNIMTWHKYGMTERIANICLSGAVCLTDSSEYLRNNFNNNENYYYV